MDDEKKEQKDLYTLHYIQKQEQLLLEFMRKNIDAEVRIVALNNSIKEANDRFDESQRQVEIGNEMINQAAASIESLTMERDKLKEEADNFKETIASLKNNCSVLEQKNREALLEKDKIGRQVQGEMQIKLNEAGVKIKDLEEQLRLCHSRTEELQSEYKNQVEQLNTVYKENEELKGGDTKKKRKDPSATLPDEF